MSQKVKPQPDWLTQKFVKAFFNYEPETGLLTWIQQRGPILVGTEAGTISSNGYRSINFADGGQFLAHRIIWLWMTGDYVLQPIDHRDRNPLNNIWINLRLVSAQENAVNRKLHINNTSGISGVHFSKKQQKWTARVRKPDSSIITKTCESFDEAVKQVQIFREQLAIIARCRPKWQAIANQFAAITI